MTNTLRQISDALAEADLPLSNNGHIDGSRVLLVRPGDTLIFSNVGDVDLDAMGSISEHLKSAFSLARVIAFSDDIDVHVLTNG